MVHNVPPFPCTAMTSPIAEVAGNDKVVDPALDIILVFAVEFVTCLGSTCCIDFLVQSLGQTKVDKLASCSNVFDMVVFLAKYFLFDD